VAFAFRDRLFALHFLRAVRGRLPRGRDPHGQGGSQPSGLRPQHVVAFASRAAQLESATRCRQALSRRAGQRSRGMIETLLLYLFAGTALATAVLMIVLRHPMRVALALIACMMSLAAVY